MGIWIDNATATDGGIVIPGEKLWGRTHDDLMLDSEGATLQRGDQRVCLGWGSYETLHRQANTWRLIHNWASSEVAGVAVSCGDDLAARVGLLRSDKKKPSPFVSFSRNEIGQIAETLDAMAALLAARPACRAVFNSRARSNQVLKMLQIQALRSPAALPGAFWSARRANIEVTLAAKRCGLHHDLRGRPLPGDVRIQEADAYQLLRDALANGGYSRDVDVTKKQIMDYLTTSYYVAPWPFEVLLNRPVDD